MYNFPIIKKFFGYTQKWPASASFRRDGKGSEAAGLHVARPPDACAGKSGVPYSIFLFLKIRRMMLNEKIIMARTMTASHPVSVRGSFTFMP